MHHRNTSITHIARRYRLDLPTYDNNEVGKLEREREREIERAEGENEKERGRRFSSISKNNTARETRAKRNGEKS